MYPSKKYINYKLNTDLSSQNELIGELYLKDSNIIDLLHKQLKPAIKDVTPSQIKLEYSKPTIDEGKLISSIKYKKPLKKPNLISSKKSQRELKKAKPPRLKNIPNNSRLILEKIRNRVCLVNDKLDNFNLSENIDSKMRESRNKLYKGFDIYDSISKFDNSLLDSDIYNFKRI